MLDRTLVEELVYRSCLLLDERDFKGYLDLCDEEYRYTIATHSPELRSATGKPGFTGPPPRSLAYAWFGPTRSDLWQTQLARRGFASLDTVEPNHNFAGEFAEDEQSAQSARRGIWAECRQVPAGL